MSLGGNLRIQSQLNSFVSSVFGTHGRTTVAGRLNRQWVVFLTFAVFFGIAIYTFYAWAKNDPVIFVVAALVSGASTFFGGFLGFLFAIPRSFQPQDDSSTSPAVNFDTTSVARIKARYIANTNLEQISDWLTKIIIGVSLVQLGTIIESIDELSRYLGEPLGGTGPRSPGEEFALGLILYYFTCGFLYGYLWTRIYLPRLLLAADLAAIEERNVEIEINANALQLSDAILASETPLGEFPSEDELAKLIGQASDSTQTTIFYSAWKQRSENWQDISTKPIMERTIPILVALTKTSAAQQNHEVFGNAGFAFKDKANPTAEDFEQSLKYLNRAIAIRDAEGDDGWRIYEAMKAHVLIQIDGSINKTEPTRTRKAKEIRALLARGEQVSHVKRVIKNDQVIQQWIGLNPVSGN